MKTSKFTSAIVTFSLVLFMSLASIANSSALNSGDLTKSGDKSLTVQVTPEQDFSYLRFDVSNFMSEGESIEIIHNSFDYLKFDVNDFINESVSEISELPSANEFEYLRFDINEYTIGAQMEITELPEATDFDYLRFDVNNFTENNTDEMIDLPVNEFDYLHFDANNFIAPGIEELPVSE